MAFDTRDKVAATDTLRDSSVANAESSPYLARKAMTWHRELFPRSCASPLFLDQCSTRSELGSRDVRFQEKRPCAMTTGNLKKLMDPSRQGQPRPDAPRCPSRKESPLLLLGQFDDSFQIHLDASFERCLDLCVGLTVDCDVEIGADPMPALAGGVCVTPKRHSDFFAEKAAISTLTNLSWADSEATKQRPDMIGHYTPYGGQPCHMG